MADVELVIKIPEDTFKRTVFYREFRDLNDSIATIKALEKATPLPKGHGKLIDVDELKGHRQIQIVPGGNGKYVEVMTYYQNDIDVAHTIIPADKESEG